MLRRWCFVLGLSVLGIGFASMPAAAQWEFTRGDVDANGTIELADAVSILQYLYGGDPLPVSCRDAADVDDSGQPGILDPVWLLSFLFVAGSPPPPAPYPACGFDPTLDALDCAGPVPGCGGPIEPVLLELAGHSLTDYPHFEFVRAFNEGVPFEVAVDPALHAELIGPSLLYVVAAKSASEWAADPTLTDVRPGGAQPVTWGGSLLANRVTVAESDLLSGDAGTEIGVGYDVILDVDGDGELSAGDGIDGLGDEAGLYVIDDLTESGPLQPVSSDLQTFVPTLGSQPMLIYYPLSIATLGPRPIVVISHGGGHDYTWYDYLGNHFASHGYVVMSHPNQFFGSPPVSLHYLEALIDQQDTLNGGVLDGRLDTDRIAFIGHSLGGQTAIQAYTELFNGLHTSAFFDATSIRFVSAIGANSFLDATVVNPEDVPFHVLYGSADGDISGAAACDQCQPLRHYDRGYGYRHVTYIHGADHNDFNCCGFNNFQGPLGTEVGRPDVQDITKAIYLSLLEIYLDDNLPARDFLWRQWESFNPLGTRDDVTVVQAYSEGSTSGKLVIDDFQSIPSPSMSSSGGAVFGTVAELYENRLDDNNGTFFWVVSDPMNGMTHAGPSDTSRGIVFEWGANANLEFEVVPGLADWSGHAYLSFRACQGTRHPYTLAADEDLTFEVVLEDGSGTTSRIGIGVYGGGIEQPYTRAGGWQNEFETIRIRLTDFLAEGSGLDLEDVAAVRFEFGPSHGSAVGRLGFDDLEVSID